MKAGILSGAFMVVMVMGAFLIAPRNDVLVPQIIAFVLSVLWYAMTERGYANILRRGAGRIIVDALLGILYVALALSLGYSLLFPFAGALLFLVAAGKYAAELRDTKFADVLWRKINVDLIGFMAFMLVLVAALFGYAEIASWMLAAGFAAGNIYWLFVNPLYSK